MSKVFKNTVIYTLGNLLPQVVAFILLPIYSKYLSPAEFGIISSKLPTVKPFDDAFKNDCLLESIDDCLNTNEISRPESLIFNP